MSLKALLLISLSKMRPGLPIKQCWKNHKPPKLPQSQTQTKANRTNWCFPTADWGSRVEQLSFHDVCWFPAVAHSVTRWVKHRQEFPRKERNPLLLLRAGMSSVVLVWLCRTRAASVGVSSKAGGTDEVSSERCGGSGAFYPDTDRKYPSLLVLSKCFTFFLPNYLIFNFCSRGCCYSGYAALPGVFLYICGMNVAKCLQDLCLTM